MRIIGGVYRSRVLKEFKGKDIRPSSDFVRESLFNILTNTIYGNSFLDAFCGTGAVGIEALSRGAETVTFTDNSRESVKLTNENLAMLKREEHAILSDGVGYISTIKNGYGVIFIDPPYKSDFGIKALEAIGKSSTALKKDGIAVYENEQPFVGSIEGLVKYDERRYGRAYLTFFRKETAEETL